MNAICCLDGEFLPVQEAKISVLDEGFLYGKGAFTTIKVADGECEFLEEHLRRLFEQSRLVGCTRVFRKELIPLLIQHNLAAKGIYRLKIIFSQKHDVLFLEPYTPPEGVLKLTLYPHPIVSPLAHLKTLSYLDRLFVKEYATKKGFHDALITDSNGSILEAGSGNVFWTDGKNDYVPDQTLPYLRGIALEKALEKRTLPHIEVKASIDEIPKGAIFYYTNSLIGKRQAVLG